MAACVFNSSTLIPFGWRETACFDNYSGPGLGWGDGDGDSDSCEANGGTYLIYTSSQKAGAYNFSSSF